MARFTAPGDTACFEAAEVLLELGHPLEDPFRTASFALSVEGPDGPLGIAGFCDSADGSVFRARFMPRRSGKVKWHATFEAGDVRHEASGQFEALPSDAPGMLQADGWGFRWSNLAEPFFWNSTTAYLIAGLSEAKMESALRRLAEHGINRIRAALCPTRQRDGGRWFEPQVQPRADFTFHYGPWPQARPDSQTDPGFDVTRFDVAYWQKFERLLARARTLGIVVQVIFFVDAQEPQNYPFDRQRTGDDPDERRYYAYAAARLASFANVEWCVTNEWALFRPDEWVEALGAFLAERDPYGHLLSVHGHGHFPFRTSPWCTHALWQVWDEAGGYDWMLAQREAQAATGRVMPQVNEEFGYEGHYPGEWGGGKVPPARNADSRRRLAWENAIAGGHATTGESASSGDGGWINGLGGESTELLEGHAHLRRFFESLGAADRLPRPDLGDPPVRVLQVADRLVVYSPEGGPLPDALKEQRAVRGFNPRTGEWSDASDGGGDWVWLLSPL